jgi:hypothetical protein
VFAISASQNKQQDRSYYKQLYNFDADVELAEYSLPVLSTQTTGPKNRLQSAVQRKSSSSRLAPIRESASELSHAASHANLGANGAARNNFMGGMMDAMDREMDEEEVQ